MYTSERGCCVPNCGKTRKDNTILHSFPNPDKNLDQYRKWIHATGIDSSLDPHHVYKTRRVCHDHFEVQYLTWTRRLSFGAVPTLHVPGFQITLADSSNNPENDPSSFTSRDLQRRREPMVDITNMPENPAPSTSTDLQRRREPMVDITNIMPENPAPSTSTDLQRRREPMIDITNIMPENPAPSTSTDFQIPREPMVDITNIVPENPAPLTSTGTLSAQITKRKLKSKAIFNEKSLLKTVSELKVQNERYALRLRKALNLSENRTFKNALRKFTTLVEMFTLMQFRESGKKKVGRRFTEPEKVMALSLYKRSPRAYKWLQRIFVLPSSATLSRLIARANIKAGINEHIFNQLKDRVSKMKNDHKLCILLFDEMSIAPHFEYNQRKDEITGFVNNGQTKNKIIADHALVFLIRGVQKNFKQPLAYTFCAGSTKAADLAIQIKIIIKKIHEIGLRVLATVCDQGTANVSAINFLIEETKRKYLQRNEQLRRDIFEIDGTEVVPLFDPPHLIKGIRNNLLNKNLICQIDGSTKIAKWDHIQKLYEEDPAYKGLRLVPKLTDNHISPDKFKKMKVKYATQVFSQKVAITMGFLAEKEILPSECAQTADIILFFDELFDSLNESYDNSKKRSGKELLCPVTPKSVHHSVWSKAKLVLMSMKFIARGKQVTVPTINNWLRTINNVEYLIGKLFNEFGIKSVWMRHFNQDPLENFFGSIRSHGFRNNNPTAAGFESTFAALLINNLSGQHSAGSNCEDDSCQIISSMTSLFKNTVNEPIHTENIMIGVDETVFVGYNNKISNPRILASLQYVTGYILRKTKTNIFKSCSVCKNTLYDKNNVSDFLKLREYKKGKTYLTYPTSNLIEFFSKVQDLITHVIKEQSSLPNIKNYIKTLLYIELDFDVFVCENHKHENVNYIFELSCRFFLCNWCKDINKILNGTRLDFDQTDIMKMCAFQYLKKRKSNKSRNC